MPPSVVIRRLAVILLATVLAAQARADVPRLSAFGDWGVYKDGEGAALLCWTATEARLSSLALDKADSTERGSKILILFTTSSKEFSLELRGAPEPQGESYVAIGGQRIGLLFEDGWGWLRGRSEDRRLRALIELHESAHISLDGAIYQLSLRGFLDAAAAAERACRS